MEKAILQQCQEITGYQFKNAGLLKLALTHCSSASTRIQSNERLEFLGDAVLGLTVCQKLYENPADLTEGEMTEIKSAVVSRQACAEIAEETGMSQLMFLGKGMPPPDALPTSVSAAVFESIVGAIYLDGGLEPAQQFVLRYVQPPIDKALNNQEQDNFKSALQQHTQRLWAATPEYVLLDEKGPDHRKCFEIRVSLNGRLFPSAWGNNKKKAEQQAAKRALQELGLIEGRENRTRADDGSPPE